MNKDNKAQLTQISSSLSSLSTLLVSLLHPWSFDRSVDEICSSRLHMNRPNRLLSYGILSRGEHLALILPCWQQYLNDHVPEAFLVNPTQLISFIGMENNGDATTEFVTFLSDQRHCSMNDCFNFILENRIESAVMFINGDGNILRFSIANIF